MNVAVIIPTLNEAETIGGLIDSLSKDSCEKEIIIVDGGSSDGTREIARSKGARIVQEQGTNGKKCPANAKNTGVRNTDTDILCFLDADVERVNECFLSRAMRHFKCDNVVGVICEREILEDSLVEKVISSLRNSSLIKFLKEKESREFAHANFLRREAFEDVGGFPLLGFGEDRVFWRSLKKHLEENGGEIAYEPGSKFFQHRPSTFKEVFDQEEWYGRTMIPYIKERSPGLVEISSTFAPLLCTISAALIPLAILHPVLLILGTPFLVRVVLAIAGSIGSLSKSKEPKNGLLIPILDLVRGAGFAKGLASYIFGDRKLSRG